MSTPITKENSITVLINSVRLGQKMGAYLLKEVSFLKKAIDFFDPNVKPENKPDLGENAEVVAVNLLLQGVQKAQNHGGDFAYSIDDAALLWDILEFWVKEGGKAVAQNVNVGKSEKEGKSAKHAANSVRAQSKVEEDSSSEADDNEIRISSKKGKDRAL
jgi:hypothetical protein